MVAERSSQMLRLRFGYSVGHCLGYVLGMNENQKSYVEEYQTGNFGLIVLKDF